MSFKARLIIVLSVVCAFVLIALITFLLFFKYRADQDFQHGEMIYKNDHSNDFYYPESTDYNFEPSPKITERKEREDTKKLEKTLNEARPIIYDCINTGGELISGYGGEVLCKGMTDLIWPKNEEVCGKGNSLQYFIEDRPDHDWFYTIECRDYPYCNGSENMGCSNIRCFMQPDCVYEQ